MLLIKFHNTQKPDYPFRNTWLTAQKLTWCKTETESQFWQQLLIKIQCHYDCISQFLLFSYMLRVKYQKEYCTVY